jgi:hypothetical protein
MVWAVGSRQSGMGKWEVGSGKWEVGGPFRRRIEPESPAPW